MQKISFYTSDSLTFRYLREAFATGLSDHSGLALVAEVVGAEGGTATAIAGAAEGLVAFEEKQEKKGEQEILHLPFADDAEGVVAVAIRSVLEVAAEVLVLADSLVAATTFPGPMT